MCSFLMAQECLLIDGRTERHLVIPLEILKIPSDRGSTTSSELGPTVIFSGRSDGSGSHF